MITPLVLGMLAGLGLWLIGRGWYPARPTLEAAITALGRPAHMGSRTAVGTAGSPRLATRVAVALGGDRPRRVGLAADLVLLERSPEAQAVDKLRTALFCAGVPVVLWLVSTLGHPLPAGATALVSLGLGVGAWFLADVQAARRAKERRREFRVVLATYLRLVTVLLAGGSGTEEALQDAAAYGTGWGFALLRRCVNEARVSGRSPWAVMRSTAERTGLDDLTELASAMALAGEAGAQVRRSLEATAAALTARELADLDLAASARTERMNVPVALLVIGFVILIIFPGVYSVVHL